MTDISGINGVSDDSTRHYTPTTEEIRTGYSTATYDDSKSEAEFDRWLAEVKAQERKKLIAELESWITSCETPDTYDQGFEAGVKEAIEHLKGETK